MMGHDDFLLQFVPTAFWALMSMSDIYDKAVCIPKVQKRLQSMGGK